MFCADPDGIIATCVYKVQVGKRGLADPIPARVLDLLKTIIPAGFNNTANLKWSYLIVNGNIWKIDKVDDGYTPQDEKEATIMKILGAERRR